MIAEIPAGTKIALNGFFCDVDGKLFGGFETFKDARAHAEEHNGTACENKDGKTIRLFICMPGLKLQTEDEDTPARGGPESAFPASVPTKKYFLE